MEPLECRRLPDSLNTNGRPVWESPMIDHREMFDREEYDKLRQTLLKYYHGDVVRTTRYLDVSEEWLVLNKYRYWIDGEIRAAVTKDEQKNLEFFDDLLKEVLLDEEEL